MKPVIVSVPEKKFVGLAADVTLANIMDKGINPNDVLNRKNDITNCVNDEEFYGLFTDPENYNPETDEFEFFMGVEVSSECQKVWYIERCLQTLTLNLLIKDRQKKKDQMCTPIFTLHG